MRRCTHCNELKPISEFGKHKTCKDGLNTQCKACNRARTKAYGKTPDGIYSRLNARANFYPNRTISISRRDFVNWYNEQEKVCVYCGIKEEDLGKVSDGFNNKTSFLSIDCKENEKRYAPGNLVLACRRCNSTKSDILTFEEMMYVGQNFIKPKVEKQLENRLSM